MTGADDSLFGLPGLGFDFWFVAFGVSIFWIIGVDAGLDGDGWGIWEWGIEQVPGFAVFFEAHLSGLAVRVEAEHGLRSADFYRDDVPDVEGDYVGGDEVDVALGVDGAAFAYGVGGAGFVGSGAEALGALDLDAVEFDFWPGAIVEDEVVALAVAEGLGDGEAALVAAVEESDFGMLSGAFGIVEDAVKGLAGLATGLTAFLTAILATTGHGNS